MMRLPAPTLNPIFLKELRQAVRSRFVSVAYCLFLLVLAVVTGIVIWAGATELRHDAGAFFGMGRSLFQALFVPLGMVCMLFVPVYAGVRMAAERGDNHLDLHFVTRLSPGAILRGKLLAALALTALMVSAALPFTTLSFRLGGVDLPSAFITLALLLLVSALAAIFTLTLAILPGNRAWRAVFGLLGALALLLSFRALSAVAIAMVSNGIGSRIVTAEFWIGTGMVLIIALMAGGLLFTLATARLSPPAANRALPVRLWGTVSASLLGAFSLMAAFVNRDEDFLYPWVVLTVLMGMAGLAVAVCERDEFGRRLRRSVPRRAALRLAVFPFFSGAVPGTLWALLTGIAALGFGALAYWDMDSPPYDWEFFEVMGGWLAYTFAYTQTGYLLWALLLRRWLARGYVWLVTLVALAIGMLTPILIGLANGSLLHSGFGAWTPGNPLALFESKHRPEGVAFALVWSVIMAVPFLLRALQAFRRFRPLTAEPSVAQN